MDNKYPKVYLAVDNCFAFKRWTKPDEWARVINDMGIDYIEASADTELDPLFMGEEYLKTWIQEVKKSEEIYGVKVANLYSGHGTYCTLGLTHTDKRIRRRMIEYWFKPLIRTAAALNAGVGFFAHAFSEAVLEDKYVYAEYMELLYSGLAELNEYAKQVGCGKLGVEQMYSPHQVPWRIDETKSLMKEVKKRSGDDFYFTEDVGHHHVKFVMPPNNEIEKALTAKTSRELWLGTRKAYELFESIIKDKADKNDLFEEMDNNPQMFAKKRDGDCYNWLRELGCYSPIVHLQQTNGQSSSHLHFIHANNIKGKIDGKSVLEAIKASYEYSDDKDMPVKCDKIYLTIEAFTGTASINQEIIKQYKESVRYWRKFVYQDGLTLDILADSL